MKVLFTGFYFDGFHGSMMHICEISDYLNSIGYECFCASVVIENDIKDYALTKGLHVFNVNDLPVDIEYDIVWSYHFPILATLLFRGLKYKKVHVGSLSSWVNLEVLPPYYKDCSLCSVLTKEAKKIFNEKYGFKEECLKIIPNFLPKRFMEQKVVNKSLKNIIVVSNHPPKEILELKKILTDVCVDVYGVSGDKYTPITPEILKRYDVVITIGKTVQYALGMGIPVYEYDYFGGGGYINLQNYEKFEEFNYSGRASKRKLSSKEIANELVDNYKNALDDVDELRKIAIERYSLEKNVDNILKVLSLSPDVKIDLNKYSRFIVYSAELLTDYCHKLNMISYLKNENSVLQKELSTLSLINFWKRIKYPKFICNIICCFIFKKKNRHHFRSKHSIR